MSKTALSTAIIDTPTSVHVSSTETETCKIYAKLFRWFVMAKHPRHLMLVFLLSSIISYEGLAIQAEEEENQHVGNVTKLMLHNFIF